MRQTACHAISSIFGVNESEAKFNNKSQSRYNEEFVDPIID